MLRELIKWDHSVISAGLLKSTKLVYCFHHFVTCSTHSGTGLLPYFTWWVRHHSWKDEELCTKKLIPWPLCYLGRFGGDLSLWAPGKSEKGGQCHIFIPFYLWYNFLTVCWYQKQMDYLFLHGNFQSQQDNGFKERKKEWWNNNNAITSFKDKNYQHISTGWSNYYKWIFIFYLFVGSMTYSGKDLKQSVKKLIKYSKLET